MGSHFLLQEIFPGTEPASPCGWATWRSYWWSVAGVWMTTYVTEPGLQSFQWSSRHCVVWGPTLYPVTSIDSPAQFKAPDKQRYLDHPGLAKGLEQPPEARQEPNLLHGSLGNLDLLIQPFTAPVPFHQWLPIHLNTLLCHSCSWSEVHLGWDDTEHAYWDFLSCFSSLVFESNEETKKGCIYDRWWCCAWCVDMKEMD